MSNTHADKLPARARPAALARRRTRLAGHLAVGELPRLADLCRSRAAHVDATLAFAFEDASARLVMRTHVRAELQLTCQRCLSAMPWRVDHHSRVFIVSDRKAAMNLPRGAEHIVRASEEIALTEIIEEEILLLMPQIPAHHGVEQCDPGVIAHLRRGRARHAGDGARRNPFAVLKSMRP